MAEVNKELQSFLEVIAKEQDYKNAYINVKPISSGGANYSSILFEVTISAPAKEDLNIFVKIASIGKALRDSNEMMSRIFETERLFYTKLALAFEKMYNKHGVAGEARLRVPKYYGSKVERMEETVALENLVLLGFENFDRTGTVDWEYASRAVEELAKFHAFGLVYRVENRQELDKMAKDVFVDMWAQEDMRKMFLEQANKMGTEVIREGYRQKVKEYLETINFEDGLKKLWQSSDGGFLIHGDYRPSNLLHRYHNGKLEIIPVDYQTLHLGTLVADLMQFIWTASDSKFRQKHYNDLLKHYYKELTSALRHLEYNIEDVYPRSTFEQELEDTKTLGLFLGLAMSTILTVDPEDAPTLDNFENLKLKPNDRALDRMNGVVEDYIRWGIIQ